MWFRQRHLHKHHEISVHPRPIWKSSPLSSKHIGCSTLLSPPRLHGMGSISGGAHLSLFPFVFFSFSFLSPIPFLLHNLFPLHLFHSFCFYSVYFFFSCFLPFYYSPSFFRLSTSSIFLVFFSFLDFLVRPSIITSFPLLFSLC